MNGADGRRPERDGSDGMRPSRPAPAVPHSTVTDLARFLGWSTLQPRRTAT